MSEVSERYTAIASDFTTRLGGISPEQWSAPTPCTEWTARDLVGHVIATHRRVMAALDGTEPDSVDLDADVRREWAIATAAVAEAVEDPSRAGQTVGGVFGEQPFESLVGRLLCADTLIHTWDLARATGQPEDLDPTAVVKAMEFLTPIDDAIRGPGRFAAKIEPPRDASEQIRLLNFSGRAV
jgi:uncharacterized protein (TIGR03086 family)